jgi:hypothetical protein
MPIDVFVMFVLFCCRCIFLKMGGELLVRETWRLMGDSELCQKFLKMGRAYRATYDHAPAEPIVATVRVRYSLFVFVHVCSFVFFVLFPISLERQAFSTVCLL